ncbi:MAG: response regulator [Clostridiales bacterium]|jgi:putative two-component system response regulator|nr:response regulator [Clostridiales bacterium]
MDKTIFVVDDNATNLLVTKNALQGDYTVVTVSSGKKALVLLDKIRPDLILLDIDMPEMDGFEVMLNLKTSENYADIPVIFLTGLRDEGIEERGRQMGAVDFITKPFSPPILLERVLFNLPD